MGRQILELGKRFSLRFDNTFLTPLFLAEVVPVDRLDFFLNKGYVLVCIRLLNLLLAHDPSFFLLLVLLALVANLVRLLKPSLLPRQHFMRLLVILGDSLQVGLMLPS